METKTNTIMETKINTTTKEQIIKDLIETRCISELVHSFRFDYEVVNYVGFKKVFVIEVYDPEYDESNAKRHLENSREAYFYYVDGLYLLHDDERRIVSRLDYLGIKPDRTERVGKYRTKYTYRCD